VRRLAIAVLLAGPVLFALLLFKHLAYPVLWNDEAETAMYGLRVLEYGYPRVHDPRNILYPSPLAPEIGIHQASDAYVATTWGHFYVGAIGAALASRFEDPYQRTFWLRLPFALLGWLGLWVLLAAVLPALPDRCTRFAFTGLFFWLACAQVSLILHLREARHPPLLVLLTSLALLGWVRARERGGAAWSWLSAGALAGVFCTFYPAYLALGVGLLLDALVAAYRRSPESRLKRSLAAELAPLLGSLVVVAPLLAFFDTLRVSAAHAQLAPFDLQVYAENIGAMLVFLIRHEHLGMLLVLRAGLFVAARTIPDTTTGSFDTSIRALARTLLVIAAAYALVMALNPSLFERYLTPIGPWISAVALLDATRLWRRVQAGLPLSRRRTSLLAAAVLGSAAITLAWHAPALAGRWHEIWHQYRGPMDEVVAFVRESYPDTSKLVVATNYEDVVLMYYLDARVRGPAEIRGERVVPDVVVARRRHMPGRLSSLIESGVYRVAVMPVRDLPFNNIPELQRWKPLVEHGMPTHQFRTPQAQNPREGLRVYWRPPPG